MVLPTAPEKLPVWMQETFMGSSWRSGHQSGCSGGMLRCRAPLLTSKVAAASERELQ
jgi:hypothetical protein